MSGPLVVLGDALLDVDIVGRSTRLSPDAPVPVVDAITERPRPGGAALAALLAARTGREVVLVAPLAADEAAGRLQEVLSRLAPSVEVIGVAWEGTTPVKSRVRVAGQSLLRLDTGGDTGEVAPLPAPARAALSAAGAILVADYGRGATGVPSTRAALTALAQRVPLVWDPHPRGTTPVPGAQLVTPNLAEAKSFAAALAEVGTAANRTDLTLARSAAEALTAAWQAAGVVVTLGAGGALLSYGSGAPLLVPAPAVAAGDPCGAGDSFVAAAAAALADGADPAEAVRAAVATAAAFVGNGGAAAVGTPSGAGVTTSAESSGGSRSTTAAGSTGASSGQGRRPRPSAASEARQGADARGGSPLAGSRTVGRSSGRGPSLLPSPGRSWEQVEQQSAAVKAAGGTVVATGGCFDLLHAGHVATLTAARSLGDFLVVCLNSDSSVRRLKGPGRPLQRQDDRCRVLEALGCVDAVVIFDEETPEAVLQRLRPDVWAKGGDYAGAQLPESTLIDSWGGSTVVLSYLDGRSTSRLVQQARSVLGAPAVTAAAEQLAGA